MVIDRYRRDRQFGLVEGNSPDLLFVRSVSIFLLNVAAIKVYRVPSVYRVGCWEFFESLLILFLDLIHCD